MYRTPKRRLGDDKIREYGTWELLITAREVDLTLETKTTK